eukprot:scaffold30708_cov44-Phaeocystis_antarctica.AAC.2
MVAGLASAAGLAAAVTLDKALVGPSRGGPVGALPAVAVGIHQSESAAALRHCVRLGVRRAASDGGGEAIARELPGHF